MLGFALLLGHLIGDYIWQNDWLAKNKTSTAPDPGPMPYPATYVADAECTRRYDVSENQAWLVEYHKFLAAVWRGHLACTLHCLAYTLAVFVVCTPLVSLPWWFYAATFAIHWPVDRFGLARIWMTRFSGQTSFATGMLAPWSIIVVDNTFHLLTLYALALAAGVR